MSLDSDNAMEAIVAPTDIEHVPYFFDGIRHVIKGEPLPEVIPGSPEYESVQNGIEAGKAALSRL